jgi:hypothetical protein
MGRCSSYLRANGGSLRARFIDGMAHGASDLIANKLVSRGAESSGTCRPCAQRLGVASRLRCPSTRRAS